MYRSNPQIKEIKQKLHGLLRSLRKKGWEATSGTSVTASAIFEEVEPSWLPLKTGASIAFFRHPNWILASEDSIKLYFRGDVNTLVNEMKEWEITGVPNGKAFFLKCNIMEIDLTAYPREIGRRIW